MSGWVFLGWTMIKKGFMCLDQEHNAVTTVKRELATPQFRLKQPTTEPLRPSNIHCYLKRRPIVQRQQLDTVY